MNPRVRDGMGADRLERLRRLAKGGAKSRGTFAWKDLPVERYQPRIEMDLLDMPQPGLFRRVPWGRLFWLAVALSIGIALGWFAGASI